MRLAYADPPYPGQSKRHYSDHPDYAGEVDHAELIARLVEYDGWALSTGSKALQPILALCPETVRVIVWIKPGTSPPFPNHGVFGWEPVIVSGARPPTGALRDWLICDAEQFTFRAKPADYVIGQKPPGFCHWLFAWLGARRDDEFDDLFRGSGGVGRAWERWSVQPTLFET